MDTTQLKKFAQESRTSLMKAISGKLEVVLAPDSLARRENKKSVEALEGLIKEITKEQVIEKVAYTWFNRFCALRYMDVNRYNKIGIVSPVEGAVLPEILAEAQSGYIDTNVVSAQNITTVKNLLNGTLKSVNPQGEAYKILFISYCNSLNQQLPFMFERIDDYSELLIPDDLLVTKSVLSNTIEVLDKETCKDIEVIGWLYQYYISEKKEKLDYELKSQREKKVLKDDMPAKTQIFTPKWIVSYMVENSVGKLWLEAHPDAKLQSQFKYYLESAEQEPEVQAKLKELINTNLKPQDIKVLDPACGSGHILVKAFDVLFEIYKSQGWQENEIPEMILANNLYGLDICDRAAQLAQFAVMMKARQYDRSIFNKINSLNIVSIKDTNWIDSYIEQEIIKGANDQALAQKQVKLLKETFNDAKEYGSLIDVKDFDFEFWDERLEYFKQSGQSSLFTPMIRGRLPYSIKQAKIMQQKYQCVVANPPYLVAGYFDAKLTSFVKDNYKDSKTDLCVVFMEKAAKFLLSYGYYSMINQQSWMFVASFEKLREKLINNCTISSMVHMGMGAFGNDFGTTSFVIQKNKIPNYKGTYISLTEVKNLQEKEKLFRDGTTKYIITCDYFKYMPTSSIAYWASNNILKLFQTSGKFSDFSKVCNGMRTGDNDRFMRLWSEINYNTMGLNYKNAEDAKNSKLKWFPYNKGGKYRKWFGNNEYVVNWENNGYEIKENTLIHYPQLSWDNLGWKISNEKYYFMPSITWTKLSSSCFGVRYSSDGFLFDDNGSSAFPNDTTNIYYVLAFMSSVLSYKFLKMLNPTMAFQTGDIANLPMLFTNNKDIKLKIDILAKHNIEISKNDWDSFETSWDFKCHPLLAYCANGKIESAFEAYDGITKERFDTVKSNEEKLNKLFIEIYGLQDEMTPEVEDKDITIRKADLKREIKSLLSYAVGCMFGRYDIENATGLAFAGGNWDEYYKQWLADKDKSITSDLRNAFEKHPELCPYFKPDDDNVIPFLSGHYFSDDVTNRFKEFLKKAFGEDTYEENMEFIANVLGKKNNETAEDTIRNYFVKDFYNDHIKMYQKRPIYWMFSSPKGSFNVLIYLHRYNKDTVNVILNSYLREYRSKLASKIEDCKRIEINPSASQADRTKAQKEKDAMQSIINEINDYERDIIYPLATERKEIDLDDGVKVNYLKFGKALKDFGLKAK